MYSLSFDAQDTSKQRKPDTAPYATRAERKAYADRYGCIPPELLRVPRRGWLVLEIVGPLVERLSRGLVGWCNATEYSLRLMAWIDTGHVYGERSISRRLRAEHDAGRLHRKQIKPGATFHRSARRSRNGTTINRWPSEKERRERLWRERVAKQRARAEQRTRARAERIIARPASSPAPALAPREVEPRTALADVIRTASFAWDAPAPMSPAPENLSAEEHRRKVDDAIARARELVHLWEDEPPE